MTNWHNPENWSSSTLVYSEKDDILCFDSTAEYETASYTVSVPEEAGSFTLSFKAGNSHSAAKEGAKDAGYITVSTDSGVIAKTPMIQDNLTYVCYTLTDAPVQAEQLYITAEAYNSYGNIIDFYFGDFELEFSEAVPENFMTEYYFSTVPTTEKVQNLNGKPAVFPIIVLALLAPISLFCVLSSRKGKKNENT